MLTYGNIILCLYITIIRFKAALKGKSIFNLLKENK